MFNRQQRDTLGRLSLVCFGAESKWQKLLDKGQFNNQAGDKPDFDQLHQGLLGALKFRLMGQMSTADLTTIIANEFMNGEQTVNLQLLVSADEEHKTTLDELVAKLPPAKSELFLSMCVVADQTQQTVTTLDAVSFAAECVYVAGAADIQQVVGQIFSDYEYRVVQSLKRNNLK